MVLNMKNSAKYFDKDYISWKGWECSGFGVLSIPNEKYYKREIGRLSHNFQPGSNVLEIGFGNGSFLKFAVKNQWRITGLEMNEKLVEAAHENGYDALHANNLTPIKSSSYDLIVAFDVLEHIAQDELLIFLDDVKRCLKPGGFFLARFPNGDSPFGLLNQNGDITHVTTLGIGKIRHIASQLEVDLVYCGGESEIIFVGHPIKIMQRIISAICKAIINIFIFIVFHPRRDFCSTNLLFIFKK